MSTDTYTLIPTEKFKTELHQQILYVAMQFSKETARKVSDTIEQALYNLQIYPYMGNVPRIRGYNDRNLRMLILEKLIIFYIVVEHTQTIHLLSVIDQRQDYVNILNGL